MKGNISRRELEYTAENLMFIVTGKTDLPIKWNGLEFVVGNNTKELPYVMSTVDHNGDLKSIRVCLCGYHKNLITEVYREFMVKDFYSLEEIENIVRGSIDVINEDNKEKLRHGYK